MKNSESVTAALTAASPIERQGNHSWLSPDEPFPEDLAALDRLEELTEELNRRDRKSG